MKINLALINSFYNIDTKLNFDSLIKDRDDIISIDECLVNGTIKDVYGEFELDINVKVKMVLASSRSFKPIPYNLDFNLDLLFGNGEKSDYLLENEIDLKEIVYGHILLEKPLAIYDSDEEEIVKPKQKNPAFSALEDFKI